MGGINPNQVSGINKVDKYTIKFSGDLFDITSSFQLVQHRLCEVTLEENNPDGECPNPTAVADARARMSFMVTKSNQMLQQCTQIYNSITTNIWQKAYLEYMKGKLPYVISLSNDLNILLNSSAFNTAAAVCGLQASLWGMNSNWQIRVKSVELAGHLNDMMNRQITETENTNT